MNLIKKSFTCFCSARGSSQLCWWSHSFPSKLSGAVLKLRRTFRRGSRSSAWSWGPCRSGWISFRAWWSRHLSAKSPNDYDCPQDCAHYRSQWNLSTQWSHKLPDPQCSRTTKYRRPRANCPSPSSSCRTKVISWFARSCGCRRPTSFSSSRRSPSTISLNQSIWAPF